MTEEEMTNNESERADVVQRFESRRAIFWLGMVVTTVALVLPALLRDEGVPVPDWALFFLGGTLLVFTIFYLVLWRCPACRSHFGRDYNPKTCPACGVRFS